MANDTRTKFPWWSLLAVLALAALLRLPSLDLPFERDEGEYATLAWSWIQGLGLPYRDFLEQKPPLAILAYAVAFLSGGFSVTALRVFALLWQLVTCSALFTLVWRITWQRNAALISTALYACLSVAARTQGLEANTELFMTLPLIAAVAILSREGEDKSWFWAGFCIGIAALAKQTAGPAALILPLVLARGGFLPRLRAVVMTFLGVSVPCLLCLLAFAFAGAAGDFWHCLVTYDIGYVGQGAGQALGNLWAALVSLSVEQGALWIAAGFAAVAAWKGRISGMALFWAWLGAMLLGAEISGRAFPHYFQPLAAPLAVLVGIWSAAPGSKWPRVSLLAAFVLMFMACNVSLWAAEDGNIRSIRLFRMFQFADAPQVADVVASRTPAGSRILIWGSEAEIYFLSRRMPATRFLFNYPFTGEAPAWPGGEAEMLAAMEAPSTSAVVLESRLQYSNPFQRQLGELLERDYDLHVDLAPHVMIGFRKH